MGGDGLTVGWTAVAPSAPRLWAVPKTHSQEILDTKHDPGPCTILSPRDNYLPTKSFRVVTRDVLARDSRTTLRITAPDCRVKDLKKELTRGSPMTKTLRTLYCLDPRPLLREKEKSKVCTSLPTIHVVSPFSVCDSRRQFWSPRCRRGGGGVDRPQRNRFREGFLRSEDRRNFLYDRGREY